MRKRARVKTSLKAQLDEELDLREGEIVTVVEILDDGWVRGVTSEGDEGTFPESFVTYLEDSAMSQQDECPDAPNSTDHLSMTLDPVPSSVLEGGPIFKDFGQTHYSSCYDEPAPSYNSLFPEDTTSSTPNAQPTITISQPSTVMSQAPDDNLNPLGVEPYAITLFPFNAQFPNELSFDAGEVVHLIKHVGAEWLEGTTDEARGFFPVSYVNVIVDCTETNDPSPDQAIPDVPSRRPDVLFPGARVKVDHTFDAQMDGDLSVTEGDVVTVVEIANDDWISVRSDEGAIGLCPRGYLNSEIHVVSNEAEALENTVIMRREEGSETAADERPKRLSEPHRPAPPAPAPGRMPLQKQTPVGKDATSGDGAVADLGGNTSPTVSEKQKRADKRQNVISELVITEKEYVRDLKVTYETFNLHNPSFLESRGVDVTILFGNIMEVIQVAEELLDLVLRAMKGCDEDYQTIAPCFLKMAEKLQGVYGKYCGNHEAALALLRKVCLSGLSLYNEQFNHIHLGFGLDFFLKIR